MEQIRSAIEEAQVIEQAIADRINYNPSILPPSHALSVSSSLHGRRKRPRKDTVLRQTEVARFTKRYRQLVEGLKKATPKDPELEAVADSSFDVQYAQFSARVHQILDHHALYPSQAVALKSSYQLQNGFSGVCADFDLDTLFTGEEGYGAFVDLVGLHKEFLNLNFNQYKLTYLQYLDRFAGFDDVEVYPSTRLRDKSYFDYLVRLHEYLAGFVRRTRPLEGVDKILAQIEQFDQVGQSSKPEDEHELYCQACQRQFATKAVYEAHLKGKKHLRNAASPASDLKNQAVRFHEHCVKGLADFLARTVSDTRANVERRQALTDKERQEEMEREQEDEDEQDFDKDLDRESDDEEAALYNPLKLPLGWDGKPIPYWLWKLHGLDVEYTCEICGNHSYQGRRVFDKHFMEPRHLHGLACLGIEPSVVFKDVVKVDEARKLWETLRVKDRRMEVKRENVVEVEDAEGNVMSEKVFNDLRKQGLV